MSEAVSSDTVTEELVFATAAERDLVQELVQALGSDETVEDVVQVERTGERRPEVHGRGIGVVEFFIIITGTVTLVRLVMEIIDDVRLPGGTIIDARGEGSPVVSSDSNLPDDSVTIYYKDGKIEFKPKESTFEVLMKVLKEVLISVLSGAKDTAGKLGEKIKDAVKGAGGSADDVSISS